MIREDPSLWISDDKGSLIKGYARQNCCDSQAVWVQAAFIRFKSRSQSKFHSSLVGPCDRWYFFFSWFFLHFLPLPWFTAGKGQFSTSFALDFVYRMCVDVAYAMSVRSHVCMWICEIWLNLPHFWQVAITPSAWLLEGNQVEQTRI